MPMHPLNLNDEIISSTNGSTASGQPTEQPRVDDPKLSLHNQPTAGGERSGSLALPMKKNSAAPLIATVFIAVLLGVVTGFVLNTKLSLKTLPGGGATPVSQVASGTVKTGDVFGAQDASAFKDSAQGFLTAGGIDGEGSHRLLRSGGDSQTVYLTSSVTDLSKFEGMDVKIWGETFRGQKAGWLMDVGRVEIVNPQGQQPE